MLKTEILDTDWKLIIWYNMVSCCLPSDKSDTMSLLGIVHILNWVKSCSHHPAWLLNWQVIILACHGAAPLNRNRSMQDNMHDQKGNHLSWSLFRMNQTYRADTIPTNPKIVKFD